MRQTGDGLEKRRDDDDRVTDCLARRSSLPGTHRKCCQIAFRLRRRRGLSHRRRLNAVDTGDAGVQAAASFAAEQLGGELANVESAQRQSVAGTNYRIEFSTSSGAPYRAVVFRALNGDFQLSSSETLGGGEATEGDHGSNQSDPDTDTDSGNDPEA